MKFGIGQSIKRIEDNNLVTGQGQFSDDKLPGEGCHVAFLRSPFAHADITDIDISDAGAADGVILAATQAELDNDKVGEIKCMQYVKNRDGSSVPKITKSPMARQRVRHAGDIVAMVVAETRQQALDAIELIDVRYSSLPAVCDVYDAMAEGAPQLYDCYERNIVFDWEAGDIDGAQAKIDEAIAQGAQLVEIDVVNSRILPNSMETRPMIAMPSEAGGLRIWCGSQGPVGLAEQIATALSMEQQDVHVLTGDVGGGFGFKIFLHPEQLCIAWAAKKSGQIVRWQQERSDAFLSDLHGRDNRTKAVAAVTASGKIEAINVSVHANMGSWLSNYSIYIPTLSACRTLTGPYDIQHAGMRVRGIVTNTPAIDAFRGAGRPEANYLMERLIDHIADQLGISRIEVRRQNLIPADAIPYKMVEGGTVDSGDMLGLLDEALEKSDWNGFDARRTESEANGKYRGIGVAMYLEQCGGGGDAGIELEFLANGHVNIYASQQDNGQAHRTTLTQIFSSRLGYDAENITVIQGDSNRTPSGTTGGARMTAVMGSTLFEAAGMVAEKAALFAAEKLEVLPDAIEFDDGVFTASGTNTSLSIEEVVSLMAMDGEDHPLNMTHSYTTKGASYPYGCHIVEIEIDKASCVPQIVAYTVVDDFGNVLNPLTLEGQIHGGIAQGVGQALYEHVAYDEDGQMLSGSLMDYTLPRADHLPFIACHMRNTPCKNNLLGVKGAGEAGAIGAPPAVISAVCDALEVVHVDMPATLQAIFETISQKQSAA